jgi:hypothetical protein
MTALDDHLYIVQNSFIHKVDHSDGTWLLLFPDYVLHVRHSENRGEEWSNDLLTIGNAINPALVINESGTVGLLYQQHVDGRWVTHLVQSSDAFATADDKILASTPSDEPVAYGQPYLGDYAHLEANGPWFVGVFSANNTPDMKNFPYGVLYQRNADFSDKTLLNIRGDASVYVSIDPFFFRVRALEP